MVLACSVCLGLTSDPLFIRGFKNFASKPCPNGGFQGAHLLSVFYSLDETDSFSTINSDALHSLLRIAPTTSFSTKQKIMTWNEQREMGKLCFLPDFVFTATSTREEF